MATQRRRPQDFTGREADRLAKARDQDAARREAELTMASQAEAAAKEAEVVDYSEPPSKAAPAADEPQLGESVEVKAPYRTVRINTDLEQVTYGAGNHYDFEAGRRYNLPTDLAQHLDEKGFVWH